MANVIFAPYLTKDISFHQHDSSHGGRGGSKPDDMNLIGNFYNSLVEHQLNAVIFHNECSQGFIDKYSTDKIKFSYWGKEHRPSYNDERFYCYLEYLTTHPDIENIFCTDLFDVIFYGDPFQVISDKYDIYVGSEARTGRGVYKWLNRKFKQMNMRQISNNTKIYNAGIVGGGRDRMIKFFKTMIGVFKDIPLRYNANMPVFLHCLHRELKDWRIFTGHPLHNVFHSEKNPDNAYIKHK